MHQEKYSLAWHAYTDHLKSMMKDLMMNEDFSDVTLVTEDKKHIKANISILGACSPVFKDILKKEKNSSPIMYLKGIQYSEMDSIIQFIYLGEATFYVERMDEFLAVARSLDIKELCNAKTETEDETPLWSPKSKIKEDPQYKGDNSSVIRQYECEPCHNTYTTKQSLYVHNQSFHQDFRYACDQCDQQYSQKSNLSKHIQAKHEEVKYACDHCDYQGTRKDSVIRHVQSMHEGIKYACNQCDYQALTKSHLQRHIWSKHEEVKYACDQCDYQGNYQANLIQHIQSKHEGAKLK